MPVPVKIKGKEEMMIVDEHPRPQSTIEALSKLKPVFKKDGTVTAGNASVRFFFNLLSLAICVLYFFTN